MKMKMYYVFDPVDDRTWFVLAENEPHAFQRLIDACVYDKVNTVTRFDELEIELVNNDIAEVHQSIKVDRY